MFFYESVCFAGRDNRGEGLVTFKKRIYGHKIKMEEFLFVYARCGTQERRAEAFLRLCIVLHELLQTKWKIRYCALSCGNLLYLCCAKFN